jgi:hypothetical protein
MKLKVYSIYDSCVKAYNGPFMLQNDGAAIRAFSDNANRDDSTIQKNPQHFSLYCLAEFDDNTGKYETLDQPQFVVSAQQVIELSDQNSPLRDLEKKLDKLITLVDKVNLESKSLPVAHIGR